MNILPSSVYFALFYRKKKKKRKLTTNLVNIIDMFDFDMS